LRRALTRTLAVLLLVVPAALAGYALAGKFGPDLLRAELETQLTRLLKGEVRIEEVAIVLEGGLRVEGHGLSAYPQASGGPALTVESASAELDLMQLAVGRFRLAWLRLEGAHFRIEHRGDDEWTPYPIARLADQPTAGRDLERRLVLLRAFETATRWLLEKPIVARRLELGRSRVTYVEADAPIPGGFPSDEPYTLEIDSIEGELRHHWISREAQLELRATLRNATGKQGRIEVVGRHRPDDGLRLAVAATAVELAALSPYATQIDSHAHLAGVLSGVVAFDTREVGHGRLEVEWIAHALDGVLPLGDGTLIPIASERGTLETEIEVHPGRLRVSSAKVAGKDLQLGLSGAVERPLRESAPMRLTADLRGAGLDDGRRFLDALPEEDRETLTQLLERIEAGRILEIGGTGSARISQWRRLLSGELAQLPPGFVLRAELEEVVLATGDRDRLYDVGGEIEWSADRFEVRNGRGRWNETVLPKLAVVVEGASNLFVGGESARQLRAEASPLPGLRTLLDVLFTRDPETDPTQEDSSLLAGLPPIQLRLARLDHPVLRWPIDDAHIDLLPAEDKVQLNLTARWAEAPVRAEIVWKNLPEPEFDMHVSVGEVGSAIEPEPVVVSEPADTSSLPGEVWAIGHFEIGASSQGRFPFEAIGGELFAQGDHLSLDNLRISLFEAGHIEGRARTDLGRKNVAGVELQFQIIDAPVTSLAHSVGLPPEIATGSVSASGSIAGDLHSGQPLLSSLRGTVDFEARDGDLQMRIPLVVAVAQATEGFNPLAEREEVHYELATARLELEHSRVSTEHFSLEGPMRVFANGEIDLSGDDGTIDAIVGVFLFRQAASTFGTIPILGALISDKGLLGAYFSVKGELAEPTVKALPLTSLAEAVPDVIKAPVKMLGFVLKGPKRRAEDRRRKEEQEARSSELPLPLPTPASQSSPSPPGAPEASP
jgi:hypothetical protein